MEYSEIMNLCKNHYKTLKNFRITSGALNNEEIRLLHDIAIDCNKLNSNNEYIVRKTLDFRFIYKFVELLTKMFSRVTPTRLLPIYSEDLSCPESDARLHILSGYENLDMADYIEFYVQFTDTSNIWKMRHSMASQNWDATVFLLWNACDFISYHTKMVESFNWDNEKSIGPINNKLEKLVDNLYTAKFGKYVHFNTESMRLHVEFSHIMPKKKPSVPASFNKCPHSDKGKLLDGFPNYKKLFHNFDKEAKKQIENGISECMKSMSHPDEYCVNCILPPLVKAFEPLHNVSTNILLEPKHLRSIMRYLSHIQWIIAECDQERFFVPFELSSYMKNYIKLLHVTLYFEHMIKRKKK